MCWVRLPFWQNDSKMPEKMSIISAEKNISAKKNISAGKNICSAEKMILFMQKYTNEKLLNKLFNFNFVIKSVFSSKVQRSKIVFFSNP